MSNNQIYQLPQILPCKGGYNNINLHTCYTTCNSLLDYINTNNYKLTYNDFNKFLSILTNNVCYKHCNNLGNLYYVYLLNNNNNFDNIFFDKITSTYFVTHEKVISLMIENKNNDMLIKYINKLIINNENLSNNYSLHANIICYSNIIIKIIDYIKISNIDIDLNNLLIFTYINFYNINFNNYKFNNI